MNIRDYFEIVFNGYKRDVKESVLMVFYLSQLTSKKEKAPPH